MLALLARELNGMDFSGRVYISLDEAVKTAPRRNVRSEVTHRWVTDDM